MNKSTQPVLSIIVVNYNTRDMTQACLDSVLAETKETPFELIVVDNASSDGSAEAIAAHRSNSQLIALDKNIGFAGANNLAAKLARGRYILLLNPDTIVTDNAIDRLMVFAQERPQARIWGGRTLFADGALNPSSCWGRMTLWNLFCRVTGLTGVFSGSEVFNGEAYGGWQRDNIREVDIVSGCFFLIETSLWNKLGGFDPAFFMYGEEADLCLRAGALDSSEAAHPVITPEATIIHFGGASESTRSGKMVKLLRAKATLISRHWHPRLVRTGHFLNAAWPLSRWIAFAVLSRISGNERHASAAATWHIIWQARSEWQHGYDTTGVSEDHFVAADPTPAPYRVNTLS